MLHTHVSWKCQRFLCVPHCPDRSPRRQKDTVKPPHWPRACPLCRPQLTLGPVGNRRPPPVRLLRSDAEQLQQPCRPLACRLLVFRQIWFHLEKPRTSVNDRKAGCLLSVELLEVKPFIPDTLRRQKRANFFSSSSFYLFHLGLLLKISPNFVDVYFRFNLEKIFWVFFGGGGGGYNLMAE